MFKLRDEYGLTPLTWGSLGQGILSGKYNENNVNFSSDDRRSREIYVNFHGEKLKRNLKIVEILRKIADTHRVPVSAVAAAKKAIEECEHYPDPLCRTLTAAISEKEGVSSSQVICGNGAADLIFRAVLALHPRRALLLAPSFAEYAQALAVVGCEHPAIFCGSRMAFPSPRRFFPS